MAEYVWREPFKTVRYLSYTKLAAEFLQEFPSFTDLLKAGRVEWGERGNQIVTGSRWRTDDTTSTRKILNMLIRKHGWPTGTWHLYYEEEAPVAATV